MPPTIDRLSPTSGWPGGVRADGTVVQGTLVIVIGRGFRATPDMDLNEVSFAGSSGGRVDATVAPQTQEQAPGTSPPESWRCRRDRLPDSQAAAAGRRGGESRSRTALRDCPGGGPVILDGQRS